MNPAPWKDVTTPGVVRASVALAVSVLIGQTAIAHEGHGHHHHHEHTHHSLDYSLSADATPYAPPETAGDGYYWWKGNLHTHTLWSDGDHFPEVVAQWYVAHGYHFLALSDHNVLSEGERWINPATDVHLARQGGIEGLELYKERFGNHWVETRPSGDGGLEVRLKPLGEFRHLFEKPGRFLMIQAEEITEGAHVIHVNATNIRDLIPPQTGETVEETIRLNVNAVHAQRRATGQPMLPHLNHPNFRWAVTAEDMAPVEGLNFFEVYNGHRGVRNYGDDYRVDLDRMWDIVLTKRLAELNLGIMYGLAVDDAHNYEHSESDVSRPGRGWVMVRARYLTPEHLISALRGGEFYSSSGVILDTVDATSDHLRVEIATDPNSDATYIIQFVGTREGYDPSSEPVTAQDQVGKIADITGRWVFVQAVADRDANRQILRVYDETNDEWHEGAVTLPAGETRPSGPLYLPGHPERFGFGGNLSEVRFWHKARAREDAENDMSSRLEGEESGLVAYWPLKESEDGYAGDGAGSNPVAIRGGRFEGESILDNASVLATSGGDFGLVEPTGAIVPGSNSFTIEMWVRTDPEAGGWNLPFEWIGGDRIYVGQDVGQGWNFVVTTDGARTDTQYGEPGEVVEIRATRRYSDDIGEVFQETAGTSAVYHFNGDEIYVRARIISSELHPNPFASGERQKAWTQPVIPGIGLIEAPDH